MSANADDKKIQKERDQDLLNTLGNPHASEDEWLNASANLGEYKPKQSKQINRRLVGEFSLLAAIGVGIFSLLHFTQPSNVHSVAPAPPPVVAQKETGVDVDFGPYMQNLQRTIKRNWFPPKGQESQRVVVRFVVEKAGKLSNLRLQKSSGIAVVDQAALSAINNAASAFKPLPAGSPDEVNIEFTFDYNVFNKPGTNHPQSGHSKNANADPKTTKEDLTAMNNTSNSPATGNGTSENVDVDAFSSGATK